MNDICPDCIDYNEERDECDGGYRLRCCTNGPIREGPRLGYLRGGHGISEEAWEHGDWKGHMMREEGRY